MLFVSNSRHLEDARGKVGRVSLTKYFIAVHKAEADTLSEKSLRTPVSLYS